MHTYVLVKQFPTDISFLSQFQIVPRWVAPNLLTFSGFLLTILNFLIIGYFDWGFDAANGDKNTVPRYIWLIAAINIFVAYTLGKVTYEINDTILQI